MDAFHMVTMRKSSGVLWGGTVCGPYLDPKGEDMANRAALGPCMDPGSTLVSACSRAHARPRRPSENLTKICCSNRISKSQYRSTSPTRLQAEV